MSSETCTQKRGKHTQLRLAQRSAVLLRSSIAPSHKPEAANCDVQISSFPHSEEAWLCWQVLCDQKKTQSF